MRLPETDTELKDLLIRAGKVAVMEFCVQTGIIPPTVSQRAAERQCGQREVRSWIRKRMISRKKQGMGNHKIEIDKVELEATALAAGREYFITEKQNENN